jgi:hypothetical protein
MGSRRRARADIGLNAEIAIGRSSKPDPNITPYARRWKGQPRPRLPYSVAQAVIIDAHAAHLHARLWGSGATASFRWGEFARH